MHFTWELSIGQVIVGVPVLWIAGMSARIYRMLLRFRLEHEILMRDWAARQVPPLRLEDLPTRSKEWW